MSESYTEKEIRRGMEAIGLSGRTADVLLEQLAFSRLGEIPSTGVMQEK